MNSSKIKEIYEILRDYYYNEIQVIGFKVSEDIKRGLITKENSEQLYNYITLEYLINNPIIGKKELRFLFTPFIYEHMDDILNEENKKVNRNDILYSSFISIIKDVEKVAKSFLKRNEEDNFVKEFISS